MGKKIPLILLLIVFVGIIYFNEQENFSLFDCSSSLFRRIRSDYYTFSSLLNKLEQFVRDTSGPVVSIGIYFPEGMPSSGEIVEKIEEKKMEFLKELIEYGNEHPEVVARQVKSMLEDHPIMRDEMIYVLGNIKNKCVNDELIKILLNNSESSELREDSAIALTYKTDYESIETLKDVLGYEKARIYDEFGVWVIDIRVSDDYKFSSEELERIKNSLGKIPKEHIERGVNVIRRKYPQDPMEILPESKKWIKGEFPNSWVTIPKGWYESLNKIINVNETEELDRIIYHEAGHGVHHYIISREDWNRFKELHKDSRNIESDFAYPYGSINPQEDFATIYELIFTDYEDLSQRASQSDILQQKLDFIRNYLPW
jgi:hypothetical protein